MNALSTKPESEADMASELEGIKEITEALLGIGDVAIDSLETLWPVKLWVQPLMSADSRDTLIFWCNTMIWI